MPRSTMRARSSRDRTTCANTSEPYWIYRFHALAHLPRYAQICIVVLCTRTRSSTRAVSNHNQIFLPLAAPSPVPAWPHKSVALPGFPPRCRSSRSGASPSSSKILAELSITSSVFNLVIYVGFIHAQSFSHAPAAYTGIIHLRRQFSRFFRIESLF